MSDDEVTREADPGWLARLRTDAADDEHTIGHGDLLDQVRAAVRDARREPSSESRESADTTTSGDATSASSAMQPVSFPPPDPASPLHSAKAAPTVTSPESRWQPPPRLKPVTPAAAPALLAVPSRPARSRRVLLVVVGAAVVALVAGVLIGRSSSSDPKPADDTAVTTGSPTDATSDATTIAPEAGS